MARGALALWIGLIAAFGLCVPPVAAQERAPVSPAAAWARAPVVAGDILSLSVRQNTELSGDHKVGAGGQLALVGLGRIPVVGLSIEEAEIRVRDKVEEVLGLTSPGLLLEFSERRPVLVLGDVENGGPVAYTDGMVVIEALALAGGPARKDERDATIRLERARIAERIETLRLAVAEILLASARLAAEGSGAQEVAVPQDARRFVDAATLSAILADQNAIMTRRRTLRQERTASLEKSVLALREEADAIEDQLASTRRQQEILATEAERLSGARGGGFIPETRFLALDRRIAEVEGDYADEIARLARVRRETIAAERAIAAVEQDFRLEIAQSASDARSTTQSLERQLEGALTQLGVADGLAALLLREEEAAETLETISVMRQGLDEGAGRAGWRTFPVSLTTPLLPGDIVRVPRTQTPMSGLAGLAPSAPGGPAETDAYQGQ